MNEKCGLFIVASLVFVVLIANCALLSPGTQRPDIDKAVDPVDLSVDPDNCAYLFGPIVGIGNHKVEVTGFIVPVDRLVRVPAGIELNALIRASIIHVNSDNSSETYETIESITIPLLENGKIYGIRTGNFNDVSTGKLLTSFEIYFSEYNTSTERYDQLFSRQVSVIPPKGPKR